MLSKIHRDRGNQRGFRALPLLSAVLATASGCSGDDELPLLKIETGSPPAYVAVRDRGTTAWTVLATQGVSSFAVEVGNEYEAVVLCDRSSDIERDLSLGVYQGTLAEDFTIQRRCELSFGEFKVTGRVTKAGQVGMANDCVSTPRSNWTLELSVNAGMHDLVMLDGDHNEGFMSVGIRRGIEVGGDMDLGVIDFDREAMKPLVEKTFEASNLADGEVFSVSARLTTAGASQPLFNLPSIDGKVLLAPQDLLISSDKQVVQIHASTPSLPPLSYRTDRSIIVDAASQTQSVTLPEPLEAVVFALSDTAFTATWGAASYDSVTLLRSSTSNTSSQSYSVVASRAFREAAGDGSIGFDLSQLPGFKNEWLPDVTAPQRFTLHASRGEFRAEGSAEVTVSQIVLPPGALPPYTSDESQHSSRLRTRSSEQSDL